MIARPFLATNACDEEARCQWQETIIIGGGMSGLGCAHRLREQDKSFLMITPEVGGRVRTSPDGKVNYGAYYVTADYEWTLPLVNVVDRVRLTDGWYHQQNQRYRLMSPRVIEHLPALFRFVRDLHTFRRHYNRMNQFASDYSREELIASDPVLMQAQQELAGDYIRRRKLEGLFKDYLDHLLWASFFNDPRQVSTFLMLAASLPLIVPMYSFEFDFDSAIRGFQDQIVYDSVRCINLQGEFPRVQTKNGDVYFCQNLVLATPMDITNRLLGSRAQLIRGGIEVSFYHVRGELREPYRGQTRNFFPVEEGTVISQEQDGSYLYFYAQDNIDKYFERYSVITQDTWRPALFFLGNEFVSTTPAPNVYLAGDHDLPSMENAFLSGRYAASQILRRETPPRRRADIGERIGGAFAALSQNSPVSIVSSKPETRAYRLANSTKVLNSRG